jgi:hypothetical protein
MRAFIAVSSPLHGLSIANSWRVQRSFVTGSLPSPAAYYFDINSKQVERSAD